MTIYYSVHKGRVPGIYLSWDQCKKQIDKFEGAMYKKFMKNDEAKLFLKNGFGENKKPRSVTRKENDDIKNNQKIIIETEDPNTIFIYTDGSCIKLKNMSKAGCGIYIPEKNIKVGSPLVNQKITNNRAEMTAIIDSFKYLDESDLLRKICIFTDSQYSMYIFNGTGERYEKDGFKNNGKDVPNIDLIKKILELKRKYNVVLLKVRAHTDKKDVHSIGNDIADKLANEGANEGGVKNIFTLENSDKEIKMNELFETDEINFGKSCGDLGGFGLDGLGGVGKVDKGGLKKMKNLKLSNWFIKN